MIGFLVGLVVVICLQCRTRRRLRYHLLQQPSDNDRQADKVSVPPDQHSLVSRIRDSLHKSDEPDESEGTGLIDEPALDSPSPPRSPTTQTI